ncbi:MAG: tetratricopeptide repeat protein [Bacteroidota bacterium]
MDLEQYQETIEGYLENSLPPDERTLFEKEMAHNPDLKAEVMKHILANEAVGILIEDKIRANLEKVIAKDKAGQTITKDKKPVVRKLFTPMRIAAGIVLLITAVWVFSQFSGHSDNALTAKFYQEASTGTLLGAGSSDVTIEDGQTAMFKEKDLEKAISIFSNIPETDPNYLTAKYYLGHCLLQQNSYSEAANAFGMVYVTMDLPQFINREEVNWNWMLAKLGAGATEEAENTIDQILKNPEGAYFQKAKELEKSLTSIWR